jgi:hypothetical protein
MSIQKGTNRSTRLAEMSKAVVASHTTMSPANLLLSLNQTEVTVRQRLQRPKSRQKQDPGTAVQINHPAMLILLHTRKL